MKKQVNLFLDSGAFSAWSKGVDIDIYEYIDFIKEYEKYIDVYANLDVIGDARATMKNQRIMEKAGLTPLPTFHRGSNIKYLEYYLKKYDYIALGGMVSGATSKVLLEWLDPLWRDYLTDSDGMPIVKVHGFAITSVPLMIRFPWYSVDSTSWVLTGRFGAVYVPKKIKGVYDYNKIPHKINVSDKSASQKDAGKHYSTMTSIERKAIDDYFKLKGYTFEELSAEYQKRDELNIIYFLDLEKNLPEWPWAYKSKSGVEGLGLL